MEFQTNTFVITTVFFLGIQDRTSSMETYTRIEKFDSLLFRERKSFQHTVMNNNDCLLLCSYSIDCLSVVHVQRETGQDLCIGYSIVFQNNSTANFYNNAAYYAVTKGQCPATYIWDMPTNLCFKLFLDQILPWGEASEFCKSDGGSLVTVDTADKQTVIEDYLIYSGVLENVAGSNGIYIGGYLEKGKIWTWLDGKVFKYNNWATDEPKNKVVKDCARLLESFLYKWGSARCAADKRFICERHVS